MSMFLPEGPGQSSSPDGVASLAPGSSETTAADIALMQRVLFAASRNPSMIPSDFMAYLVDFMQTSRLEIPIGQVFGFSQFSASLAVIETQESTTSTSFTDLATAGPSLDGLSAGRYVALWGASCFVNNNGFQALVALNVNGSTDAGIYTEAQTSSPTSLSRGTALILPNAGNSVKCVYASGVATNTASFRHRWLLLLKYANL